MTVPAAFEPAGARAVAVRVPATSANLGPGFDTLGLALSVYDELVVTALPEPGLEIHVTGEGAGEVPTDASHLVVRSMAYAFEAVGRELPGIRLDARNTIPHGRGMGSSGAAVVAGLLVSACSGLAYLASLAFTATPATSACVLLLGRVLLGCGESLVVIGALSWGVGLAGPQNAGKVMAWVGIAMYGAYALGAPAGVAVHAAHGFAGIGRKWRQRRGLGDHLIHAAAVAQRDQPVHARRTDGTRGLRPQRFPGGDGGIERRDGRIGAGMARDGVAGRR